ncbi:cytochrome b-245 chaperone 1 isoform X5 [Pongo pygmaeus]|uniref:cytochrome b-245 chaperone 1 isoform X5 n=2 Tax=Pongo pygmaeus TaxID=9600 RepID=UPI00300C8CA4
MVSGAAGDLVGGLLLASRLGLMAWAPACVQAQGFSCLCLSPDRSSCREWCCHLGMYLQVETRTSSRLHLKRAPGIRSWSLLVGILSIGLAAAYYSGDSLGWKLFYVTGCLFVAVQNLEDWEEAVFDKSTGKVVLKTFSLYKKLLTLFRAGHDQVVVLLHDVRDVSVEEEKVRYFGKGYMVVLRLATGFSHPLTQSAVMGHRSSLFLVDIPSSQVLPQGQ